MNNYQQKYLKYKKKYLNLKNEKFHIKQYGNNYNFNLLELEIKKINNDMIETILSDSQKSLNIIFKGSKYILEITNNGKLISTLFFWDKSKTSIIYKFHMSSVDVLLNKIKKLIQLINTDNLKIFFEKQEGLGCGRHALNNLFQRRKFVFTKNTEIYTEEHVLQLITDHDRVINLNAFCKFFYEIIRFIPDPIKNYCSMSENYDYGVLNSVLNLFNYTCDNLDKLELNGSESSYGYFANLKNGYHWICIKKNGSSYVYYDSLYDCPLEFDNINDVNIELRNNNVSHTFAINPKLLGMDELKRQRKLYYNDLDDKDKIITIKKYLLKEFNFYDKIKLLINDTSNLNNLEILYEYVDNNKINEITEVYDLNIKQIKTLSDLIKFLH